MKSILNLTSGLLYVKRVLYFYYVDADDWSLKVTGAFWERIRFLQYMWYTRDYYRMIYFHIIIEIVIDFYFDWKFTHEFNPNPTSNLCRNLLFRTINLLNIGARPLFVIEGEAPILKWNTIKNRIDVRTGKSKDGKTETDATTCKRIGKRTRLKSLLKQVQ